MRFSSFTFILTEKCNFDCIYCYQKGGKKSLEVSAIHKALDFFFPYFSYSCDINFNGGEPLVAFDSIKEAVDHIEAKGGIRNFQYYLTTNGSLVDHNVLEFLSLHKFSVILSFDGFAQNISRKKGSFDQIVSIMEKLKESRDIALETNSVFTPKTVGHISESIQFLINLGIPKVILALSTISPWDSSSLLQLKKELTDLNRFLVSHYKKTGTIPFSNYRHGSNKDIFACVAGRNQLALAPDGTLWGCNLFPELFVNQEKTQEYSKYCFGDLDSFKRNHEKVYSEILANYAALRLDKFYTDNQSCNRCPELGECWVCPVNAAFSSSVLGKIPDWLCKINKIFIKDKKKFWAELI